MSWTWQEVVVAVLVGLSGGILIGYVNFRISEYLQSRKITKERRRRMKQERLEAAKEALWGHLDSGSPEWTQEVSESVLAAADAVMFSEEAKRTIAGVIGHPQWCQLVADGLECSCTATDKAEEIVSALKGDYIRHAK